MGTGCELSLSQWLPELPLPCRPQCLVTEVRVLFTHSLVLLHGSQLLHYPWKCPPFPGLTCMSALPACMYLFHILPQRPAKGIRSSGTGITTGCVLPCGYRESKLDHLQERVLVTPETSLQPFPWGLICMLFGNLSHECI